MNANHFASSSPAKLTLPKASATRKPMTMPHSTAMLPKKPFTYLVISRIDTSTRNATPRLNGSP